MNSNNLMQNTSSLSLHYLVKCQHLKSNS